MRMWKCASPKRFACDDTQPFASVSRHFCLKHRSFSSRFRFSNHLRSSSGVENNIVHVDTSQLMSRNNLMRDANAVCYSKPQHLPIWGERMWEMKLIMKLRKNMLPISVMADTTHTHTLTHSLKESRTSVCRKILRGSNFTPSVGNEKSSRKLSNCSCLCRGETRVLTLTWDTKINSNCGFRLWSSDEINSSSRRQENGSAPRNLLVANIAPTAWRSAWNRTRAENNSTLHRASN